MNGSFKKAYQNVVHLSCARGEHRFRPQKIQSFNELSWYVGQKSRTEADEILKEHGLHGTYLLRKSPRHDGFAISVRYFDTTKHFYLEYNQLESRFNFGPQTFSSLTDLVEYLDSKPIINHETDEAVCLKFPLIKPHDQNMVEDTYEEAVPGYKEGYLIKRGHIHKNWKLRWFMVHDDVMSYYESKNDDRSIRDVDISTATEVTLSDIDGKNKNLCFCLILPSRTFYFECKTPLERECWMDFFRARIIQQTTNKNST